ncbi:MAG: galactose-1-phosphate uridylyltransferase, partial [Candidatus Gallimonas sp.]
MDGRELTEQLIAYAKAHLHLEDSDEIYYRNVLLSQFGYTQPCDGAVDTEGAEKADVPDELAQALKEFALSAGRCDEEGAERYVADIFGLLTPLPSQINRTFFEIRQKSGAQAACDYLYGLCVKNGYIQKTAIARNLKWKYEDEDKPLEITVNLSKPEKNNKDIAKLLTAPQGKKYPACALCKENEGFEGTATHPPRRNIRTVKLTLGGEKWFMQYSPYAYYDEHCIVINEEHVPMRVDGKTPEKLLDFVDLFPNY